MALVKHYKVLESQLSSLPIVEGQIIYTTDTKKLYIDINSTTREEYFPQSSLDFILPISSSGSDLTVSKEDLSQLYNMVKNSSETFTYFHIGAGGMAGSAVAAYLDGQLSFFGIALFGEADSGVRIVSSATMNLISLMNVSDPSLSEQATYTLQLDEINLLTETAFNAFQEQLAQALFQMIPDWRQLDSSQLGNGYIKNNPLTYYNDEYGNEGSISNTSSIKNDLVQFDEYIPLKLGAVYKINYLGQDYYCAARALQDHEDGTFQYYLGEPGLIVADSSHHGNDEPFVITSVGGMHEGVMQYGTFSQIGSSWATDPQEQYTITLYYPNEGYPVIEPMQVRNKTKLVLSSTEPKNLVEGDIWGVLED